LPGARKPCCPSPSRQAGRSSRRPALVKTTFRTALLPAPPRHRGLVLGLVFRAFEKVLLFPGNQLFVFEGRTQGDGTYISSNIISSLCWWSIDNAKGDVTFTTIPVKASFYQAVDRTEVKFQTQFEI